MEWTYVPVIESGSAAVLQWNFANTNERRFLRLAYTDASYTGPVGDADFDADGLTNNQELITTHTDPLKRVASKRITPGERERVRD